MEQNAKRQAPTSKLTKRQSTALDYVADYMLKKGYPPTIREIGDAMGIKSTNGVNDHLKAIERKGYIVREESKSRAIRPLFMPDGREFEEWKAERQDVARIKLPSNDNLQVAMLPIPVLGIIQAGQPITAIENRDRTMFMDASLFGKTQKEIFALTVQGESMIEAGIYEGDIIFVRQEADAPNGTIVAVKVDNQVTVKRFFREPDCIRLKPANSTMEDIIVTGQEATETAIIGVVISLFRDLK